MKSKVVAASVVVLTGACVRSQPSSDVKLDSAHSIALDAVIPDGVIWSTFEDPVLLAHEVNAQLYYTMGQLNGENGVADLARLEVSINEVEPLAEGATHRKVHYAAKVLVAWDRSRAVPATYELVMPARGDASSLGQFFETFKDRCTDPNAHDMSAGIYWYYYRPQLCDIAVSGSAELVQKMRLDLTVSSENTEGRAPEYAKVWEDGQLVVTAIFGKYEPANVDASDAGISAYNQMYRTLLRRFGAPASANVRLAANVAPRVENPDIALTWTLPEGTLDVRIMLVDDIKLVDDAFQQTYNERTSVSDHVSYSGHSGLGANIRRMARMGRFVAGQWQLFLVNGCDTFAYVDNALRDAHHAVNQDASVSKYFDIITNAMPSYFHMNTQSNMAIISALIEQRKTYREILQGFDPDQKAVVTGEEDNTWPHPF